MLLKYMQKLLKVFNPEFYKLLITALLIFIPLFPKFPAFRLAGTYVSIRLEDFLILFSFFVFLISFYKNRVEILKEKIVRVIILFIFIGLVSTISAIFLTQTVSTSIALMHWLRRVEYFSLFFMGFIYIKYLNRDNNIFEYIIKTLLLINFFIFIYGMGQRYFNFPVVTTQNEEYSKGIALRWIPGSHINSTFAGHYDLASYLVLTVPIFVILFFSLKDKISKIIIGVSVGFSFWLFSMAVSRISIVAFLIATSISLFLLKKYREIILFGLISLIIFGFSPSLRSRYNQIFEVVKEKLTTLIVIYAQEPKIFEDRSTSIRINVEWPRAIRAFTKNPLLGTGYSSITLATDNDYLRVLGEMGLLGLGAFILIFLTIYKKFTSTTFDNSFESIYKAGFVGSTLAILITAIFIDVFESSKFATMYWLYSGLVLGSQKDV